MSAPTRPGLAWRRLWAAGIATFAFAFVMSSCGGGGVGSGGTGSPQTNLGSGSFGSGTVTGFGSLIVDGVRYANGQVPATVESQPGVHVPAAAKLGDFAELEFGEPSEGEVLRAIRIEATAVGRVDAIDAAGLVLTVLGQTIVENRSPDAGPVTFYAGIAGLHALRAGDDVEVHGVPRWNSAAARYEILATRIERLPAVPPFRRLAGVVQHEGGSGMLRTFRLGDMQISYSASAMLPAGSALRDGDHVVVWSDRPPSAGNLTASAVRITARSLTAPGKEARLGGTVSRLDASSKRFDLAGVEVRYGNALITPRSTRFVLANDAYVVAEGTYASDGALEATRVKIRKRDDDDDDDDDDEEEETDSEVELTGPIENFVGIASFSVRGTPVDALGVQLQSCAEALLRNGLNVRIEGQVQPGAGGSVVKAESVRCVN